MPSPYEATIIKVTRCTQEEAPKVELLMRDAYSSLDGLRPREFSREAKLCLKALRSDPELAELLS